MVQRPTESENENGVILTTTEILHDAIIELVLRDIRPGPELLLSTRGECVIAPQVEHDGKIYRAPYLHPSIVKATRLANQVSDYGSTRQLIDSIAGLLHDFIGLAVPSAQILILWIISTWFPDCVPSPRCLVVSGFDMALAVKLFLLLKCLVRRGLVLTEVSSAGFGPVVATLHPTVLLNQPQLPSRVRNFWRCSNFPGIVVPGSGGVVCGVSCAKALFVETEALSDVWSDAALHVALMPTRRSLPLLDERTQSLIADEYLPKFLMYRLRNVPRVQESMLASDPYPTGADALQSCVLDAPEFAQIVSPLLEAQLEDGISQHRLDPARAIVEVLWIPVHGKVDLHTGKIADLMNTLLRCRGEVREYSPAEVGWKLRHLGLYREREGKGMVLRMSCAISQRVHLLARQFGLNLQVVEGCPDCAAPEALYA